MSRIQSCLPDKKTLKDRLELVVLFISYFLFLLIGGILIAIIEKDNDKSIKNEKRLNLINGLKKYNISTNDEMIQELFALVVDVADAGGLDLNNMGEEVESDWGFGAGLFFCTTIVTTIGYGHIYPKTVGGRWFVIFYALIGIPLTGVVLGKFGIRLTRLIKKLDNFLSKPVSQILGKIHAEKKLKYHVRIVQVILVIFIFILCFWIIPALIMTQTEGWDINTAIYFCFITITTIGLGDVVPGVSNTNLTIQNIDINAIAKQVSTLIYLILGLSALTIILTLVKSMMDIVATTAKETAENITDKGKAFAGNMAGSVKNKIRRKTSGVVDPGPVPNKEQQNATDVDGPPSTELEFIPEEKEPVDEKEPEYGALSLDAMLNPNSEEPNLTIGFDNEKSLSFFSGDATSLDENTTRNDGGNDSDAKNSMPDVIVK